MKHKEIIIQALKNELTSIKAYGFIYTDEETEITELAKRITQLNEDLEEKRKRVFVRNKRIRELEKVINDLNQSGK